MIGLDGNACLRGMFLRQKLSNRFLSDQMFIGRIAA